MGAARQYIETRFRSYRSNDQTAQLPCARHWYRFAAGSSSFVCARLFEPDARQWRPRKGLALSSLPFHSRNDLAVSGYPCSRHKGPSPTPTLVVRENRFRHRDPLAGSRLESCERRHHPLEAVPKHGDAGRRRATLRCPGPLREGTALADQKGKVVLVNIGATWCAPCRAEMPRLDRLYQERKDQGLIVFGFSDEDVNVQRKYVEQVPVRYPLLTPSGEVPKLYRDIARYPAIFLIDRRGRLQPAPGPDQPFEKLEAAVVALLNGGFN
jgi:thiol-disulfide isomerase/thioredoxin